jgi:multicomponent Na+:H+ antiporter subunit E
LRDFPRVKGLLVILFLASWSVALAVWLVLTGGRALLTPWALGVTLAGGVTAFLIGRGGSWPVHVLGFARFAGFFLLQSFLSGLDVALRALRPAMPLDPAQVTYTSALPNEGARVFFANTISLMPGTLTCALEGRDLTVHVLDGSRDVHAELARLERVIGGIFGLPPWSPTRPYERDRP